MHLDAISGRAMDRRALFRTPIERRTAVASDQLQVALGRSSFVRARLFDQFGATGD